MRLEIAGLAVAIAALGCAEAGSAGGGGSSGVGGGAEASSGAGAGGAGGHESAGGGPATTGSGGQSSVLRINEISASGDDWVEIVNPTGDVVDLTGYAVTDSDKDGGPDENDATVFADGTFIGAYSYAMVLGGQDDDGGGIAQTDCLGGDGPATCFWATWKVSNTDGDSLFLLDPSGGVVDQTDLPPGAVADGETWGRLPDGTGDFVVNQPTPGEPNQAP